MLAAQLDHAFVSARWQVEGLTDEEFFWEPTGDAWSVHPRDRARGATPIGRGPWVIDAEWPLTSPAPLTTVAWRLVHLAMWTDVYRSFTFASGEESYDSVTVPSSAADAVAWLERAQGAFAASFAEVPADRLSEIRPTHWGGAASIGTLVWVIAVEHLHHGAEIGVLRDLHRGRSRTDWWPGPLGP